MFSLLHLLSYVGALAAFLFVTLSLASGLLWLAELIEEHSRYAKTIGMRGIYTIIGLHVLLLYTDSFPALPVFFSIACHLIYLSNFTSSWPLISLSSPRFLASCLLVIADHFTWFFHFANKANEAKRRSPNRYSYGNQKSLRVEGEHGFMDVAAFFGICVWAAPLFLFLSLSANDNALPSMASAPPSPGNGQVDLNSPLLHSMSSSSSPSRRNTLPRISLIKTVLVPLVSLLPRLRRRKRNDDEGLLAPRTPIRGSPIHSPVNMGSASGQPYFPWGQHGPESRSATPMTNSSTHSSIGYGSAGSNFSAMGNSLSPETAKKPPGPPRRVQSEVQLSRGPPNPRGVATRGGVPVMPDQAGHGADPESGSGLGLPGFGVGSSGGVGVSLGPQDGERIGGAEVIESSRVSSESGRVSGLTRRKAD